MNLETYLIRCRVGQIDARPRDYPFEHRVLVAVPKTNRTQRDGSNTFEIGSFALCLIAEAVLISEKDGGPRRQPGGCNAVGWECPRDAIRDGNCRRAI